MDLTGKILIAMPGLGDPRFDRSVILLLAYSVDGAMGLIINKPTPDLTFDGVLAQMKIDLARDAEADRDAVGVGNPPPGDGSVASRDVPVHYGGPVERGRGFVLHGDDWPEDRATLRVPGGFGMTATVDILHALVAGHGPQRAILALGYAGWGAGQLDAEIARNDWLIADAGPDLIFSDENSRKWTQALRSLGIDPVTLSAASGRA